MDQDDRPTCSNCGRFIESGRMCPCSYGWMGVGLLVALVASLAFVAAILTSGPCSCP